MSAKTFAVNTMNGLCVMPKIAGIESSANTRSVVPIAMNTMRMGVKIFFPSTIVRSFTPSYSLEIAIRLRRNRITPFSRSSMSWWFSRTCWIAVNSRNAPKM